MATQIVFPSNEIAVIQGPLLQPEGTVHDNDMAFNAGRILANPPVHQVIGIDNTYYQYDPALVMYQQYYRTGDVQFRDMARQINENMRTSPKYNAPRNIKKSQGDYSDPEGTPMQSYVNMPWWSFATYVLEHGSGDPMPGNTAADIINAHARFHYQDIGDFGPNGELWQGPRSSGGGPFGWMVAALATGRGPQPFSFESGSYPSFSAAATAALDRIMFAQGNWGAPPGAWSELGPFFTEALQTQGATVNFLMAILMGVLIKYDVLVGDARIVPALINGYNYLETQWNPTPVPDMNGTGMLFRLSYNYTDRHWPGEAPGPPSSTPRLNGFYMQPFGYLFHKTGNPIYAQRIHELWEGLRECTQGATDLTFKETCESFRTSAQAYGYLEGAIPPPPPPSPPPPPPPPPGTLTVQLSATSPVAGGPNLTHPIQATVTNGAAVGVLFRLVSGPGIAAPVDLPPEITGTTPFTLNWSIDPRWTEPGTWEIAGVAREPNGFLTTSPSIFITVTAPGPPPPPPSFNATVVKTTTNPPNFRITAEIVPADVYVVDWFLDGVQVPALTTAAEPLHKPVLSRCFVDRAGRGKYLAGSHNWNSVTSWGIPPTTAGNPPSVFDFNGFLADLVAREHTATRFWVLGDFVKGQGATEFHVDFPWARSGTAGAADGGNKWNLSAFHQPFFDTLRARIIATGAEHIVSIVNIFNGWDDQFNPDPSGKNIWSASQNTTVNGDANSDGLTNDVYHLGVVPAATTVQKALVHKLVDELNDQDLLVWEIINEPGSAALTWVQDMIADLRAYELTKPKQHPIMQGHMHAGGVNSDLWSLDVEAVAPSRDPSPDGAGDYLTDPPAATGLKVVVADNDHVAVFGTDTDWVWKSFCRALHPLHMDGLQATKPFSGGEPWPEGERTRDAITVSASIFRRFRNPFADFLPQSGGTSPANTGYCLFSPGIPGEWVVFKPTGGPNPVTLDLTSAPIGSDPDGLTYQWIHPLTGAVSSQGFLSGGAIHSFPAPSNAEWVLFVYRANVPYSFFGLQGAVPIDGNLPPATYTFRADVYDRTTLALLAQPTLVVNTTAATFGAIINPTSGQVFTESTLNPKLVFDPSVGGVLGVTFRLTPAAGGSVITASPEITVPDGSGNFVHDPFVHSAFQNGNYLVDAVIRTATEQGPFVIPVAITINNTPPPSGGKRSRRLRARPA